MCDYRMRLDVMDVTVLLDIRAVNRLFHSPKVLIATTSIYGPSGVVHGRDAKPPQGTIGAAADNHAANVLPIIREIRKAARLYCGT